jgi:small multidrug resistance pump
VGWLVLGIAILSEVAATAALTAVAGQWRPLPVLGVVIGYVVSFVALSQALRTIDVAVAYALWSAFGTAAIAAIGVLLFHQSLRPVQAFWLIVIVVAAAGLQLSGGRPSATG